MSSRTIPSGSFVQQVSGMSSSICLLNICEPRRRFGTPSKYILIIKLIAPIKKLRHMVLGQSHILYIVSVFTVGNLTSHLDFNVQICARSREFPFTRLAGSPPQEIADDFRPLDPLKTLTADQLWHRSKLDGAHMPSQEISSRGSCLKEKR